MVASQPHIPERFAPQPPSAPPPPSSTGLSSAANHIASSQAAQSSGKQHRQRVCSLLVPVLAAVAAVWVLQLFSHQEALVESYNVVFMHGLLNAKAHVRKYTDPAVVVCRGVGLEMAEHRLDHVGTSAMDNMLWRYLQVESGVSQIVVATSAGTMSGVERLANGSHVVFSVDETGAQGWAISATGVRLPGPVLLDSSFLAAGISWFVASNASVRGDAASTQWHSTPEASSLGDSADMAITCTRWHPTLTADRVLVAVSTRVSSIVPSSSFMHVPFLAQQPARFSEARGVLMSEAGMVVACSHPPCATTGFGSSEDLVTSSIHALLTTFGSLSSVPGSWTQSGLYSNSVCVLRIGTGETQPAWLLVVVVPPDSIRMSRVVEMVVSAVFCMLLLASILVAWALGTSVKGYHGPGVPRTRVVSMLGVAAVVCGLFVLWELSAQPGRDEVLLDLSTCIHAHATQEMANLVAPVRTIAALAAAAGEDHTVNLTQAALATTGDELERFLGRLVEATTETTTVVAGTMLGLANGDLFAALPTNEPEFQVVGRRSASTSHLLTFSPTHPGNWSRVSGSPLLLPAVSFDASQEAWFIAADGKREAWSPVFSLPYSNHHGVAATASFGNTSCATAGQDGVWGVMIDARALEQSMVTVQASIGFGMATAATVPAPETFVATGDLTQLTLLASSDSTSLQLDASTGTVTRVVVTQSSTDTIATVGKQLAAWSSTSLTASDLPYKSEMTSMGFGMDELLVSVLWMDDHVPVKGINWTAVLVLSKEAVRSPHREWTSVSLVVTVPVLFAAVMLSIALRPGHDLISAAARRWGMARGVLLAAVGRPLPLSLEKSLQKRQQERLERLADKALKAVQALAVRRRRSTTTQQRFWRSRSRQSYVMDSGQSLFDTQTNNGGIRRRRRLGPNPSVRQEMLTATTGLPPMPGIATQPRRVGVSSSFGLESPNHPHHGQQGRQGMLGVAQSFLVNEHDRRNSGGAEFAAEASRLADSSADVSQFQAGVAEHQPHDARPSHHAFARRSSTDASGPVHVSSVEDSTMSVGSGAGDMDAELADSIATVNLLEESVHDQARVITVAPDPGNTRLQQVSVSGRSDVPTESVDGVVSDGARRLEAPKAPRFTGVGSTEEVRSASHPVPPQHSSNASPEPAAGETATQIGASQASSVLSAANVVDDPDDIILAPYEEPNCMVALGEHLPSRRQVVGCYEQVVQFIDDTIEFEDAHTPIGVVPDAALRCRPCQQRFVLAAIAVSGVPDSQRGDIVAVAHSIVNQAYAGSNVMHHWFMHIASGSATARRTVAVSQLLRAAWYRRSISAVVITHMVLTFWEGSSPESRPASRTPMYLAQAAILVVYALDTVLYWYGYCRSQPFGANLGVHASFAGNIAEISKRAAVRLVFTLVFVIDLVVQYHTDYTTGPGTFIPYTSLLRPVFLLSRSSPMRRAVSNFASTLVLSRKVILLSLAFVSVAVVTSVALLGRVDGIAEGTATAFVADTFGVAEAFLINVFVFVATGENYPDVVVPAGAEHSALVVYFMVLEVAGLLILSSLLIAFFQQFYNRLYELSTSARRRRQLTIRQLSLMLAFRLMQLVDTDKTTRAAMLHTQARRRGLRTRAQLRAAGGPSGLSVVTEASVETAGSVTDSAQCSASGTASAEVRGVSSTEQVASDSQAASDIPFEDAQSHTEESVSSLTQGLRQQVSLPDSTDSDSIPSAPRSMGRRRTTRPRGLKVDTSSTTPGFPQAHPFQPISYTGRGDRHAEMLKRLSTAAHLLVNTRSLATSMSRMMFVRFFQTCVAQPCAGCTIHTVTLLYVGHRFGVNLTELGRVQYDEHQRYDVLGRWCVSESALTSVLVAGLDAFEWMLPWWLNACGVCLAKVVQANSLQSCKSLASVAAESMLKRCLSSSTTDPCKWSRGSENSRAVSHFLWPQLRVHCSLRPQCGSPH